MLEVQQPGRYRPRRKSKPFEINHEKGTDRWTDCAVEAGRVASSGGRIQREKMPIGEYGFIALAFDTKGNMFGLHSMQ